MKVIMHGLLADGGYTYWGWTIYTDTQDNLLMVSQDICGSGNSQRFWQPPLEDHYYEYMQGPNDFYESSTESGSSLISRIQEKHPELTLTTKEVEQDWKVNAMA